MVVFQWRWFMRNVTGIFDADTGPAKGYRAMSFFIFIILRDKKDKTNKTLINHEKIHFRQQIELLFIGQWLMYIFFWVKLFFEGNTKERMYRDNPFEKEAYDNEDNFEYLKTRKLNSWIDYV